MGIRSEGTPCSGGATDSTVVSVMVAGDSSVVGIDLKTYLAREGKSQEK
jgi:hypothetical protein